MLSLGPGCVDAGYALRHRTLEGTLGLGLTVPAEDGHPIALWAAPYKMNDQGDNRPDQENVNQAPRDVEYKPTKDPCDEQGHE